MTGKFSPFVIKALVDTITGGAGNDNAPAIGIYLAKLAAITRGAGDAQLAAAPPPDSFTWRRAALFTVRSGAAPAVQPDAENDTARPQSERPPTGHSDVAMAAVTPPSIGLFVPVSGRPAP